MNVRRIALAAFAAAATLTFAPAAWADKGAAIDEMEAYLDVAPEQPRDHVQPES